MLRQEDPDSRLPAEFVDALICLFRRDQSQKLVTAGPTSILDRGLTSILRPMVFMASCAEEESLEEIAIKALGPPRSWSKNIIDAIIGCLSNQNHGVKMAVLSALKEDPEVVATRIKAISARVNVEYSPVRKHAVEIISEQQHLPQTTLESITIRLCRPKEERIVGD
ncbi:NACHT LRR and PYD domains-containing 3 [Fusarium albosuccineum]|uniref:NACHT LRR and PYD domains-containing 3 n=1 Tax=Fusarium albosuccineum TaxID=1237068 RepID=A0A8H4PHL9_9HYPO|nr:NACHT LRR and PYD domains-containing 3 [Fusarium albosuccineum]